MSGLRVALVAGQLGRGGAERQLVLMAGALAAAGARVRVFSMTRGDHHGGTLERMGLAPVCVGRASSPPIRAAVLSSALLPFRPHVVQAGHFFVNLYATIAGRLAGAAPIGAIRSDLSAELRANGAWGRRLLHAPPDIVTNSWRARRAAEAAGRNPATVHVVPSSLDLAAFDGALLPAPELPAGPVAMFVGSLRTVKRPDRFLRALAAVRRRVPVAGVVVGDGPERRALGELAAQLGLGDAVRFLGERDDVPALLRAADLLVLTSDHEGVPNAVLEAMAARLPVVATAVGDVDRLVAEGRTGFVVPADDEELLASRLETLAASAELRRTMGAAAREAVESWGDPAELARRLIAVYQAIAARERRPRLAAALA